MTTSRSSRRGPRKQLIRESDGTLHDLTTDQSISPSELREFIAAGGFFEARRQDGAGCTPQVLTEVLQGAIANRLQPGMLGAVLGGAHGGMSPAAALEPLVQMLGMWGSWGGAPGYRDRRRRTASPDRRRVAPRSPRRRPVTFEEPSATDDAESP